MKKVILILIDGLGSDYFARHRSRLPYLDMLASDGFYVERMPAEVPGTSLPGRVTLLTGADTAAHGVYGNNIYDGDRFRLAQSGDIAVPGIASRALAAGRDVVGLGFGMLQADDTLGYVAPWWEHVAIQGSTNRKIPADQGALVAPVSHDRNGRIAELLRGGLLTASAQVDEHGLLHPQMIGLMSDHAMLRLAAELACGVHPPDLILTEIAVTDTIQHYHGCDSEAAHWAMAMADMEIGRLVHRIERAGRLDEYTIVVTSDHGHAAIHTALYPEQLIPHRFWATEGASLHVKVHTPEERADIEKRLSEFGVKALPGTHLPVPLRETIVTFSAPLGWAFERRPATAAPDAVCGAPVVVSTHGLMPGTSEDDRICIVYGGGTKPGIVRQARATQVAPTIAQLLGLIGSWPDSALPLRG